ncbi:MAG: hypothetical protein ACREFE_01085 [Limisphaerales bacterium]
MKQMNPGKFAQVAALLLMILSGVELSQARTVPAQAFNGAILSLEELAGDWEMVSNLLSLPALNDSLGSAKEAHDALAVGDLSFPPITMTGDTGSLFVDGNVPTLEQSRWFAYQALRTASAGNLKIETAVRMPYEQRGLLFHIALTNDGTAARNFELKINLSAATSRHKNWGWGVPRPKDAAEHFSAEAKNKKSLLLLDSTDQLANCFSFAQKPDELSVRENSAQAIWRLKLKPGAGTIINYSLAIGEKTDAVEKLSAQWAKHFDATFTGVQSDWQKRFDAMFTPHNSYFSGSLPRLVTPDKKMRRVYYMSAVSLLSVLRTGFPVAPRVFVSNTPESNCTMMYFWDTREWATTFALLDPVTLKNCLRSWLAKGIYNGYAEEYLTGTLQGPWYSANDYSVFILLNDYLNVTGDRKFLSEKINGKTVLEHMDAIATNWKRLVKPGQTLADYGAAKNLLECVPTYINEVASFNAANVWMMRRVAEIQGAEGNHARAEELRADANHLLPAVLALYVPGQGVWDALHDDGTKVQVRHVFDFTTIGLTIPNELSPKMRDEMTDFVERELLTDHWMRAQSLSDIAAAKSNRPDHGPMGAFCAWPAETIATFCEFGKFGEALDFLHRCEWVTHEGPFSQSRELLGKKFDSPARITSRGGSPTSHQTYNASNGGSFAETIIREFFGYQPDFLRDKLISNFHPRGFEGELLNVRQGEKFFNIVSGENGIQIAPVK